MSLIDGIPVPPARRPFVFSEETGSTNTDLKKAVRAGSGPVFDVIWANRQTAGRGRQGNRFFSPDGGVYFSAAFPLRPSDRNPVFLSLLAGLAAAKSLEEATGAHTRIKWPNDLILNGKKLAGILCEYLPERHTVVMGIGINVSAARIPEDLQNVMTTLAAEGYTLSDREALIRAIVSFCDTEIYKNGALDAKSGARYTEEINARSFLTGKRVLRRIGGEDAEGRVLRIDPDGALVLLGDDGRERRVTFGEARVLS